MATTKQKQAQAAEKRRAKSNEVNTTSWVDEGYAARLQRQLYDKTYVKLEVKILSSLSRLRQSPNYIAEVKHPSGTKAFFLDASLTRPGWLILGDVIFNGAGKIKPKAPFTETMISPHAAKRMFERLRTNSPKDFTKVALHLAKIGPPIPFIQAPVEFKVPEGTFYLELDSVFKDRWVVKTFI